MLQDGNFSPVISMMLDDKPRKVLLDTGGFWSMVRPEITGTLVVRKAPIIGLLGLQDLAMTSSVIMPSIQIGPAKIPNAEFYIAPPGYIDHFDGTLGANWLSHFDVEIDPVKNTASMFSQDHCEGSVVYWPHEDYAVIPFTLLTGEHHIIFRPTLDGKEVKAMIDTGAPETVISTRAAKHRFGLTADSPGMQIVEKSTDTEGHTAATYRYQFSTLDIGGIAFKNPRILISDMADSGSGDELEMILGMHQLHALHLYFAYKERKLYATSAHAEIAVAGSSNQPAGQASADPLLQISARNARDEAIAKIGKGDRDGALASIDDAIANDPNYSDGFITRANVHAARGERDLALKDYAHALQLAPENLHIYVDRAIVEWEAGDKSQALADIGQALQLDPGFVRAYKQRMRFEIADNDLKGALTDAGLIVGLEPNSGDSYATRASIYAGLGNYAQAYDDETKALKLQPRSAPMLNDRCWVGAIMGKLDDALDDCNAALEIAPKNAQYLDSRGFVRFKRGQWERAITDYSSALEVKPKFASAFYGRGLAKRQNGDSGGAQADMDAAQKIDPKIAEHFGK